MLAKQPNLGYKLKMKRTFSGTLGQYEIIETEDGSKTVRSCYFDENSHSTSGAWSETIHNYVKACAIPELAKKQVDINILEIGFANGIGPEATIKTLLDLKYYKQLNFVTSEIDPEFAKWTLEYSSLAKLLQEYNAVISNNEGKISVKFLNFVITIYLGDLRKTITTIRKDYTCGFDAIFQDPYSPRKNPTLWTQEWFKEVKSLMKPRAILSTYCAAVSFRRALLENDFYFKAEPGFGRKRFITTASLDKDFGDIVLMEKVKRSKAKPFQDGDL